MADTPHNGGHTKHHSRPARAIQRTDCRLQRPNQAAPRIRDLFEQRLAANDLLPMDDSILLVETSYFNPPIEFQKLLGDIVAKGYRPLLAHPERYKYMDIDDYASLKEQGILFQLNLGAIAGGYSKETQHKAAELLARGWYDFVGSDCHSLLHYQSAVNAPLSRSVIAAIRKTIKEFKQTT